MCGEDVRSLKSPIAPTFPPLAFAGWHQGRKKATQGHPKLHGHLSSVGLVPSWWKRQGLEESRAGVRLFLRRRHYE